ncbi:uncharacterized protein AB675_10105 [Cyphellophora attinorum]|uniref:Heterokaryon incompatibility domain-containing protein n=1 Tax=Cyphellophora attinorum TaxID=1664694 RepID=A0A0N0NJB1_9EURO|nr:uncharacterized protein AB675_10105 [Phialophora attinorum]KPI36708.1 hypothetical protein AB675_10105 [Phialophora attinorum]
MFHHTALPTGWIRLLQARGPSSQTPDLQYDLISLPLTEAAENGYEALSYVWGDDTLLHGILINGQLFHVRHNLHDFLHVANQLRWASAFWIDAICIDQHNVNERNSQVRMMTDIYKSATTVRAWLGREDLGFKQFHRDRVNSNKLLKYSVHDGRNLDFLLSLAACEYWQRAWIVQELTTARKVHLQSGVSTLHLDDLWDGLLDTADFNDWHFRSAPSDVRFRLRPMLNVLRRADHSYPQLQPFESIIHDFSNLRCAEPRDHIYAFHALFQGKTHRKLPIDYEISIPELISKALDCCETKTNLHSLFTILRTWQISKAEQGRDPDRLIHARLCPKMDHRFQPHDSSLTRQNFDPGALNVDSGTTMEEARNVFGPELELAGTRTIAESSGSNKHIFLPAAAAPHSRNTAQPWCLVLVDVQYDLYFTKPFNLRNPLRPASVDVGSYAGLVILAYLDRDGKTYSLSGQPHFGVWLTDIETPDVGANQSRRRRQTFRNLKALWECLRRGLGDATWRRKSRSEITVGLPLTAWMRLNESIRNLARNA